MKHQRSSRAWGALCARALIITILFSAVVIGISSLGSASKAAPLQLKSRLSAAPAGDLIPGVTQSYSYTITNPGPARATNIQVRANIDSRLQVLNITDGSMEAAANIAHWTIGELAAGQSRTVSFMGRLSNLARNGDKFEVHMSVTGNDFTETSDVLTTNVKQLVDGVQPHLVSFQTVSPSNPSPGDEVMFHVIVHNDGQLPAQGVVASERMPKGLELIPDMIHPHLSNFATSTAPILSVDKATNQLQVKVDTLMPNEWVAMMFSARVSSNVRLGQKFDPSAVIEAQSPQLHTTAPVAFQIATAKAASDNFSITVTSNKAAAAVGDKVTYTITVTNSKANDISKLKITNKIPAELKLVGGSPTTSCGLKIVASDAQIIWKKGILPASGSCAVSFQAMIASNPTGNVITETASVKSPTVGTGSATGSVQTMVQAPNTSTAAVDIMDNFFSPAVLMVPAGTVITWTHRANGTHTVTSSPCDTTMAFTSDSQFASGLRNGNQFSFTVPADAQPGTIIYYFCKFHGAPGTCTAVGPGMAGTIMVQ